MEVVELDILKLSEESIFFTPPKNIYKDDENYIPEKIEKTIFQLKDNLNKYEILILVVKKDNTPLSRGVFYKKMESDQGFFGFFESYNKIDSCKLLFKKGEEWLKEKGCKSLTGPINFDTWHSYRINSGPFEKEPFLLELYNPDYYFKLIENSGFEIKDSYFSKETDIDEKLIFFYKKSYEKAVESGFKFIKLNKKDFNNQLSIIHSLSINIFNKNPYYEEIDKKSFIKLYKEAKAVIKEELIWFALNNDDEYCGFVFAYPNYFKAVKSMNGKKGLISLFKFLINRSKAKEVNIKTLGIDNKYRGTGIASGLMYKVYENSLRLGYKKGIHCLMHESNDSLKFQPKEDSVLRRYHLYKKRLIPNLETHKNCEKI